AGIHIECLCLIRMGQIEEPQPLFFGDFPLVHRNRHRWIDRLVARKNAAPEEVIGSRIESKLTIPIEKSLCNPLIESLHHLVDVHQLDDSLELLPLYESQGNRRHDAEKAIPADRQLEQIKVLRSTARHHRSIC